MRNDGSFQRREGSLPVRRSLVRNVQYRFKCAAKSDPRDQLCARPIYSNVQVYENADAFAAREDPTSPVRTRNEPKSTGYVGQAARPPLRGGISGELQPF
jgi:hypothetical protein